MLEWVEVADCRNQVPDNYLRAIFGSYLASRFVYEYGSAPSQFAFFDLYVHHTSCAKGRANTTNSMSKRMAKV